MERGAALSRAKGGGRRERERGGRLFEAWKRSLDATIEVPDCEPAINAPSPRGKREPRVGGGGRRRTTPLVQACRRRRRRRGIESFLSKEGGRDEHVVREGGGEGRWKGVALSGCESSGSREGFFSFLRGIRLEGSWQHIELPYPYFTNREGREGRGEGGGSASHKSADVRGEEGKKKRGKRERNERERGRERDRGSFAASYPVFCFDQEEI